MAVNNSRSMNADLHEGATEGSWQRLTPSRGGVVESEWPLWRAQHMLKASWGREQLAMAVAEPEQQMFDYCLRDRISIVTGPTARTRPVARNQFEANPYPTPLDASYTTWPNEW